MLRPGGMVGLSDLTRTGEAPPELRTLLAWVACLGDAHPIGEYAGHLEAAGFMQLSVEPHDEALGEMVRGVRAKLMGVELMAKLGKLTLPVGDLDQAKQMARAAATAVQQGRLGYALLIAVRG